MIDVTNTPRFPGLVSRQEVMDLLESEIGNWADSEPPRHALSVCWGKVRDMGGKEDSIARAKLVAKILTENGQPVTPPDEVDLDDVERERWNVCMEIVKALDQ